MKIIQGFEDSNKSLKGINKTITNGIKNKIEMG